MLNHDRIFFRFVLFSDKETTFHNTGQLNRRNFHYWCVENSHWYRKVNQHRWSFIVWYDILNLIGSEILLALVSLTKILVIIIYIIFTMKIGGIA